MICETSFKDYQLSYGTGCDNFLSIGTDVGDSILLLIGLKGVWYILWFSDREADASYYINMNKYNYYLDQNRFSRSISCLDKTDQPCEYPDDDYYETTEDQED